MMSARNQIVAKADHIRTLKLVVLALSIVLIGQWLRIGNLQETRRIYVPPDLSNGLTTQFDVPQKPVVYTFAYYIYQQLHRWKTDGYEDYQKNIYRLQAFVTPNCLNALEEDMNDKHRRGELLKRVRSFQEIPGRGYVSNRVFKTSQDSWNVWLDINVKESINGHEVKNISARYQLKVVLFDVDKELNPWGLAIACELPLSPKLITQDELEKPFQRSGDLL